MRKHSVSISKSILYENTVPQNLLDAYNEDNSMCQKLYTDLCMVYGPIHCIWVLSKHCLELLSGYIFNITFVNKDGL